MWFCLFFHIFQNEIWDFFNFERKHHKPYLLCCVSPLSVVLSFMTLKSEIWDLIKFLTYAQALTYSSLLGAKAKAKL